MNYSDQIFALATELQQLRQREADLVKQIATLATGRAAVLTAPADEEPLDQAEPLRTQKLTKEDVLRALTARKQRLDVIVNRVADKLGYTPRAAAVGACLAALVRKGRVEGDGVGGYFIPKPKSVPATEEAAIFEREPEEVRSEFAEEAQTAQEPEQEPDQPEFESPENQPISFEHLIGAK